MSLVVAYKRNKTIYMGADTQSTCDSTISRALNESGFKITRHANGMLIGVCGRVKGHQKIVAQKHWFDIPENETLSKRYIVKNIIPELSELMGDIKEDKDARNSSMEVRVLIAHKDKMFIITRMFNVLECETYAAIGAGDSYSKYYLSQIKEDDDINEGLIKALRAGACFDSTVSAPFVLIDTENREYKLVEG